MAVTVDGMLSDEAKIMEPVREYEIAADAWSVKAAIERAAALAFQWWWSAPDSRLELSIEHVQSLEQLVRGGWRLEGHGPMRVMLQIGYAAIMWTWPDVNSVSILDASKDGRRIIVRKAAS